MKDGKDKFDIFDETVDGRSKRAELSLFFLDDTLSRIRKADKLEQTNSTVLDMLCELVDLLRQAEDLSVEMEKNLYD